ASASMGCNQVFGLEATPVPDASVLPPPIDAAPPVGVVQSIAIEAKQTREKALPFMQPVAAGDAIIAAIYIESSDLASVTDTLRTSFAKVVGPIYLPVRDSNVYLYAGLSAVGGLATVSVPTSQ